MNFSHALVQDGWRFVGFDISLTTLQVAQPALAAMSELVIAHENTHKMNVSGVLVSYEMCFPDHHFHPCKKTLQFLIIMKNMVSPCPV